MMKFPRLREAPCPAIPPFASSIRLMIFSVTGGLAAFTAFVDALTATYVGASTGQEWILVNSHPALLAGRPNGTRPSVAAVPASWYDVTSIRLNTQVGSLRSRKQGVGS